jgi:hypothetical protein
MNRFEKILLTIFFVELFVGGGGRLIDFGVLSIRQVLFLLVLLTFAYRIVKEKAFLNKEVNTFIQFNPVTIGVYALIAWFVASSAIGIYEWPSYFHHCHGLSKSCLCRCLFSFSLLYFKRTVYTKSYHYTFEV